MREDRARQQARMTSLKSHTRLQPCWLAQIAHCHGKQAAPVNARLRPRMEPSCDSGRQDATVEAVLG